MRILPCFFLLLIWAACGEPAPKEPNRPNVLVFITDDQSFAHTSMAGCAEVATPAFDRVAREGIWLRQAFAASPGCSPSRAALLTGRHCWQIEAAGTHASHFPSQYATYPDLLAEAGYHVGYTGKGWGPGKWELSGRANNPAGPEWNRHTLESPGGISDKDYTANFESFLAERKAGQPFCFWVGTHEPHRVFEWGIGADKDPARVSVPDFLPDTDTVRQDLLDYYTEIEWADRHLGQILAKLEAAGELDNTLIIVTSDNGMAFPRGKANLYEYGFHVPMAIRWGNTFSAQAPSDALVSFVDLAPTILEASGIGQPGTFPMTGKSILPLLLGQEAPDTRTAVLASRERHSSVRYHSLGYPQRALRTDQYLLVWNAKPERWPAGAPQKYEPQTKEDIASDTPMILGPMHGGYHDIDACPSLTFLVNHPDDARTRFYLDAAVAHRSEWELFDIQQDPGCMHNLSDQAENLSLLANLTGQLQASLLATEDPRLTGDGDIFETYPRYSRLRYFPRPDWAIAHPEWVPEMDWLVGEPE